MATIERLQLAMALLALLLAQLAIAGELIARHMQMQQPQPFAFNEFGPTNPLNPDGSDYPCKVPQGESYQMTGTPTEMAIGEDQTVSFSGTAVHGGGSCQFALAEGLEPTKDTPWKVIQSIEGGVSAIQLSFLVFEANSLRQCDRVFCLLTDLLLEVPKSEHRRQPGGWREA